MRLIRAGEMQNNKEKIMVLVEMIAFYLELAANNTDNHLMGTMEDLKAVIMRTWERSIGTTPKE